MPLPETILDPKGLAELLGIPFDTVYRQAARPRDKRGPALFPPHFKIGARYYWRRVTVEKWLAEQEGGVPC